MSCSQPCEPQVLHHMFVVISSNAEFEGINCHGIGLVLPHYSSQIKSIPWLLMTWVLVSPGHQQTWFRLYWVNKSLLSTKKDYLLLPSVEKWLKMLIYFYFPLTEFTKTRVKAFSQGKSQRMNMCDIVISVCSLSVVVAILHYFCDPC